MNRIKNSWELIKASASVLASDKELLVFPLISSIGVLIVSLTFFVPLALSGLLGSMSSKVPGAQLLGFMVLFVFYVFQYFVIIFSNSALVGAALIRLNGGDPTLGDGFRIALSHIGSIFGYAVISATVGTLLRMLAERNSTLGRLVISLIGLAWNIATFLVLPILVIEDLGPLDAIKRSVSLLKKTWGEQLAGTIGLSFVFSLITIGAFVASVPFIIISLTNQLYWLAIIIGILLIFGLSIVGLINGALSGIFTAAVYRYAVEGETSEYFPAELIQGAFLPRK
jgi:hypothetical protein